MAASPRQSVHSDTESKAAAIADSRDFECFAGPALRVQANIEELLARANNADVAVAGLELLGLSQRDRAQLLEFGIWLLGIGGRREEPCCQSRGAGVEKGPSIEHVHPDGMSIDASWPDEQPDTCYLRSRTYFLCAAFFLIGSRGV
jgi:hypothetical protein